VVYHAGAGIRTGGAYDRARGLPANFWDQVDGDAQGDGITRARTLLPGDVADKSWRHINGHWADAPIAHRDTVSRIYAAKRGAEFYCSVIAVIGYAKHPVLRNCQLQIFNPLTAELLTERSYHAGELVTFIGPDVGGLWGTPSKATTCNRRVLMSPTSDPNLTITLTREQLETILEARREKLIEEVQTMIDTALQGLQGDFDQAVKYGDAVGLQAANGQVICAEQGGPAEGEAFVLTGRSSIGAWERWVCVRGE
jgi:hypothetical protein